MEETDTFTVGGLITTLYCTDNELGSTGKTEFFSVEILDTTTFTDLDYLTHLTGS